LGLEGETYSVPKYEREDKVRKPKKRKKRKKARHGFYSGGKVRGAGKATQGVRKCKMVTMKGS